MAFVEGTATSGSVVVTDVSTAPPPAATTVPNLLADRAWRLVQDSGAVGVDAESDRLLEGLVRGILGPALPLSLAAHGDGVVGPWELYTNPEHANLDTLDYAVQWTGATVATRFDGELDESYLARARLEARRPRGMFRGSERGLLDVARPFLTGSYQPRITPVAGDLWTVLFEIPPEGMTDSAALEAALNDPSVIPAGMRVVFSVTDRLTWNAATVPWDAATETWDTFNGIGS